MFIEETAGVAQYRSPFIEDSLVGSLNLKVDISTLTTNEVDKFGKIRPGLALTRAGRPVSAQGTSTPAAAVANDDNTGNGTVGSLVGKTGGKAEVITLRATSSSSFEVRGSKSGILPDATVGTPYTSDAINFTITAGGNAFAANDEFTIVIAEATPDAVFGVVPEATKIVGNNPTNTSLANTTDDKFVGVGVIGVVDRDAVEHNLGRTLTAAEIAAFQAAGCHLVLSRI